MSATPQLVAAVPTPHPGHATGPRTPAGKTRAALNAIKHGIHSSWAVIPGEAERDFKAYFADMATSLQPRDVPEQDLVEQMVMCQWKLRRLWRQETHAYDRGAQGQEDDQGLHVVTRDCYGPGMFAQAARLEAHLMRSYRLAQARLGTLQDQRRKRLRPAGALVQPALAAGAAAQQLAAGAAAQQLAATAVTPAAEPLATAQVAPHLAVAPATEPVAVPVATPVAEPQGESQAAGTAAPARNASAEKALSDAFDRENLEIAKRTSHPDRSAEARPPETPAPEARNLERRQAVA